MHDTMLDTPKEPLRCFVTYIIHPVDRSPSNVVAHLGRELDLLTRFERRKTCGRTVASQHLIRELQRRRANAPR